MLAKHQFLCSCIVDSLPVLSLHAELSEKRHTLWFALGVCKQQQHLNQNNFLHLTRNHKNILVDMLTCCHHWLNISVEKGKRKKITLSIRAAIVKSFCEITKCCGLFHSSAEQNKVLIDFMFCFIIILCTLYRVIPLRSVRLCWWLG